MSISRNNHYIPRMYLSRWLTDNKISIYQLLVSHKNVWIWKRESIKRTGCLPNLYVNIWDDEELDSLEHDLDVLIESPAKIPFDKVCDDRKITSDEWKIIGDYITIQYVRTPMFYFILKEMANEVVPEQLNNFGIKDSDMKKYPKEVHEMPEITKLIPINVVVTNKKNDANNTIVEITTIVGKGLWLSQIKLAMNKDSILRKFIRNLRWNIITAPEGMCWATCDNPVVICDVIGNTIKRAKSINGVKGKNKAILFPVSPKKVLLATINHRYKWHNIQADVELANMIQRAIINNAMMYIYSRDEDATIPLIRPRVIDRDEYKRITNDFDNWFETYKDIEGPLLNRNMT